MTAEEFSRPIALDRIGVKEKSFTIEADVTECSALAERLGIPAVISVRAEIALKLTHRGKIVRLSGFLHAELRQICVVTLEPVATFIEEPFSRLYLTDAEPPGEERAFEMVIDPDEEDPPEQVLGGQIDIGEAASEHLALAMDPFPRAPDAAFEYRTPEPIEEAPKPSPFEALAATRKKF